MFRTLEGPAGHGHCQTMKIDLGRRDAGPVLDMTPDGRFRELPMPTGGSLAERVFRLAVVAALVAAGLAIAALALWFALILIPFVIAAGLVAYGALRWHMWRAGMRR